MHQSFANILIPVDLSVNTEVAVKKALDLADIPCTFHLVYVDDSGQALWDRVGRFYRTSTDNEKPVVGIELKLQQWKRSIQEYHESISVYTWKINEANVQKAIEEKAIQLKIDLIIIGKNSNHSFLPFLNTVVPSMIVTATGIPVLTAKPGSIYNKLKTVVVPISDDQFYNKIALLSLISKKCLLKVYLVCFNDTEPNYAGPVMQMHQWLKSNLRCSVEVAVINGTNKARALLKYAERINADFMLLASDAETKGGWLNNHISDLISPRSKIQVLTVKSN